MGYYRKRERDNSSTIDCTISYSQNNEECEHTALTTNQIPEGLIQGDREVMFDIVVPGFEARSRKGEVFVNPMTREKRTWQASPGSLTWKLKEKVDPDAPCYGGGSLPVTWSPIRDKGGYTPHLPPKFDIKSMMTLAGTRAAANVEEPDFQGLTALAELRETLSYLKNPVKGWQDLLKKIRHDKWQRKNSRYKAMTVADFAADQWLTYRFAMRPILSDLENFAVAYDKLHDKQPVRKTARGSYSDYSSSSATYTYNGGGNSQDIVTNDNCTVRAGILYEHSLDLDNFGLTGLKEIPSTLWEVVHLSFVVDYFANIGSFVRAVTPKVGISTLGEWTTVERQISTHVTSRIVALSSEKEIVSTSPCFETTTVDRKTRTPGIDIGLASKVSVQAPSNWDSGTKAKLLDMLALAEKLLKSR